MDNQQSLETAYFLRITLEAELDKAIEIIKPVFSKSYIIGTELSKQGKKHFHAYFYSSLTKDELKNHLNNHGLKGNQSYSFKKADTDARVKRYCVKEGDYAYSGFTKERMDAWIKSSHKKVDEGYSTELSSLEDDYISNNLNSVHKQHDLDCFAEKVIKLQLSYGMKPHPASLQRYTAYWYLKKYPIDIYNYVKQNRCTPNINYYQDY